MAATRTPSKNNNEATNDDEAERHRRRTLVNSEASFNTELEQNESLRYCVQLYNDNKLDKNNAWNIHHIDSLAKLIKKHHNMINFKLIGTHLEISAKVYSIRVDSLHSDVMSLYNELVRMNVNNPQKQSRHHDKDDEVNDGEEGRPSAPAPKKRVKRRTYIAKREAISAPLEVLPFEDPFFAIQKSLGGDFLCSKNLIQNTVSSDNSALDIKLDSPFFTEFDYNFISKPDENNNYEEMKTTTIPLIKPNPQSNLHKTLAQYDITDKIDDDDEEESTNELTDAQRDTLSNSQIGLFFDINAEVEPIPDEANSVVMADFVDDVFDNDTCDEERIAVAGCRGLQRQQIILEDMRPVDNSILEYSYRPVDQINQYWAGPSHWKYKPIRASSLAAPKPTVAKTVASKKKKTYQKLTVDEILNADLSAFVTIDPNKPLKGITLSKSYINKRWDPKKLLLPTDLKLDREMFNKYKYAPSLCIRQFNEDAIMNPPPGTFSESAAADGDDDDDYFDSEDINNSPMIDGDSLPNEMNVSAVQNASMNLSERNVEAPMNDIISEHLEDAPDKVAKITIAYSKKPKRVDMKLLKQKSWEIINDESKPDMKFSTVLNTLPKTNISEQMKKNLSPALVFYSILHLANEKKLSLHQNVNCSDIAIQQYQEPDVVNAPTNEVESVDSTN